MDGGLFGLERMVTGSRVYIRNRLIVSCYFCTSHVISLPPEFPALVHVDPRDRNTVVWSLLDSLHLLQCLVAALCVDRIVVRRNRRRHLRFLYAYPRRWRASRGIRTAQLYDRSASYFTRYDFSRKLNGAHRIIMGVMKMTEYKSHYPNFNVLHEEEHWDPHTQKIVDKRVDPLSFYPYQFFTQQEAETLFQLCSVLLDDQRYPVIIYVVHYFDSTLNANVGESQRKIGVPKQSILIRDGLVWLDQVCQERYDAKFASLDDAVKIEIVNQLIEGSLPLQMNQDRVPISDFMDKIRSEAVAAYYSHPSTWSEIGYAGPAYPRGYVRSELGLTDPWEAKRDG